MAHKAAVKELSKTGNVIAQIHQRAAEVVESFKHVAEGSAEHAERVSRKPNVRPRELLHGGELC